MTYGRALLEARLSRGMSRADVCRAIRQGFQVKRTTRALSNIEDGRTKKPHETTYRILAQIFPELTRYISK